MKKRYIVRLALEDRAQLQEIGRREPVRRFVWLRVQILLKTDRGPHGPGWSDGQIADVFDISRSTVVRVRKQYTREGLEACLQRKSSPRPQKRRLDGASEARLIALACGPPPTGQARWTLKLLADKMVVLEDDLEQLSYETVRRTLKKTASSLI